MTRNDFKRENESADRKKEVIDLCLNKLISEGLAEITVRELSASLNLSKAGIYWYFKDKDEIIVSCAEEAANRLETNLLRSPLLEIHKPDLLLEHLYDNANEMAPTMRFFVQVCTTPRYHEKMAHVISSMSNRNKDYVKKLAKALACRQEKAQIYFSIASSAICNYMIFENKSSLFAVIDALKQELDNFQDKCDRESEKE